MSREVEKADTEICRQIHSKKTEERERASGKQRCEVQQKLSGKTMKGRERWKR